MGIFDAMLGRRDKSATYRTIDGGHPAPFPDMTDEQLGNYERAFGLNGKATARPPAPAQEQAEEKQPDGRPGPVLQAQASPPVQEALPPLDWSRPVRTVTTKQPVEIITTRVRHPVYPVQGYIGDSDVLTMFTADGRLSQNGLRFLENSPAEHSVHLNIYRNPDPHGTEPWLITQHATREEADRAAGALRLACVRIAL